MDSHKERKYVTINEAAEICGVTRRCIYNWIEQGYLKKEDLKRTPSGTTRIDKTKLLNAENRQRVRYTENLKDGV